jgi:hypothetical protein
MSNSVTDEAELLHSETIIQSNGRMTGLENEYNVKLPILLRSNKFLD